MDINKHNNEAEVRFFGGHERYVFNYVFLWLLMVLFVNRAYIPKDSYFLLTESNAHSRSKNGKGKLDSAVKELLDHIQKLETKFAIRFPFAPQPKMSADRLYIKTSDQEEEEESDEEEEEEPLQVDVPPPVTPDGKNDNNISSPLPQTPSVANNNTNNNVKVTPRSKIAQDLKKTLENNKKKSLSMDQIPVVAMPVEPPPQTLEEAKAQLASLQTYVAQEKARYEKILTEERKKYQKSLEDLKKRHESDMKEKLAKLRQDMIEKHALEVSQTKKHQWCSFCSKNAIYYCCWNTSYCSAECQSSDWNVHMNVCQQDRSQSQEQQSGHKA